MKEGNKKVVVILSLILIFVIIRVFQEYHYILDYKRDERIFKEYEDKKEKDLYDIVEDTENCGF
jgi:hypothetical protein